MAARSIAEAEFSLKEAEKNHVSAVIAGTGHYVPEQYLPEALRGRRGQLRDEVLVALRTPVLFVQGSRDALCPLAELEAVRARMSARTALHVVEGGNHSLEVGVRALAARARALPAAAARRALH